jgi:hypothetical protein
MLRLCLVLATCAYACGGGSKDPTIGKSQASHAAGSKALPPAYRNQVPALSDAAVLNFLPDSTVAAWFLRSPGDFAAATEFQTILAEYKSFYAEASAHLSTAAGANLLVPSTWHKFGVDSGRPAGVALLIADDPVGVFFVTLEDRELFRNSLEAFGAKAGLGGLVAASAGESTILVFQKLNEIAILVRGDVAMLVTPDRDDDLEKVVLQLSGSGSQPSLASSGRIAKAFAGFDHGKDMAGFVAFDTIIAMMLEKQVRNEERFGSEMKPAVDRLAQARADGAPLDEIARLTEELEDERRWQRREDAQNRLLQEIFGAAGTVAIGVNLDPGTTRVRAQLSPQAGGLLSQLFANRSRALALPTRLVESPLFLLGAQANPAIAKELFELFLQAEGTSVGEFALEMKKNTGVHPNEIVALLDGELSGALTLDTKGLAGYADQEDAMGLHLLAHLKDPLAARALLDTLCASPKLSLFAVTHEGKKALELPSFNERKIRLEIVGDFLQARSVSKHKGTATWRDNEKELLQEAGVVATMAVDPTLLGWLASSSSHSHLDYGYGPDQQTPRHKEIREELKKLYKTRDQLQTKTTMAARDAVGRLVMAARPHASGLAVLGSFSGTSKNLGRSLQTLIEAMVPEVAEARSGKDAERARLDKRIRELEDELWR